LDAGAICKNRARPVAAPADAAPSHRCPGCPADLPGVPARRAHPAVYPQPDAETVSSGIQIVSAVTQRRSPHWATPRPRPAAGDAAGPFAGAGWV